MAPGWQESASTSMPVVRGRWERDCHGRPFRSYLVCTGGPLPDGRYLVVLDVDPKSGGIESLGRLMASCGLAPDVLTSTATVRSGGHPEGRHYYFGSQDQLRCAYGHATKQGPLSGSRGLDLKGLGGYVIGPGSLHKSGNTYCVIRGFDLGIADLPDSLARMQRKADEEPGRRDPPRGRRATIVVPHGVPHGASVRHEAAPQPGRPSRARLVCTRRIDPERLADRLQPRYGIVEHATRHNCLLGATGSAFRLRYHPEDVAQAAAILEARGRDRGVVASTPEEAAADLERIISDTLNNPAFDYSRIGPAESARSKEAHR